MTKIAFFEAKEWEKDYLTKRLSDFELVFFEDKLSQDNVALAKDVEVIAVFIDSQINKEIIEALPNLKMVAARSTGFDHIDLKTCQEKNILVCNVPHYGDNAVAEYTFALILDLSRKIHQSIQEVRDGGFSFEGLTGFDLKGKTLGVVGTGNIGQHVIRIAKGFEMNVLAYDVFENKENAEKLGFNYDSLENVFKNSDIISLHVPYNEHTHHLINAQNINLIKRGAYLINTSRGGVIETNALVKALANGTIGAAGLDVLEEENFVKEELHLLSKESLAHADLKVVLENHILMEQENVIITPHNAFNSREALEKILETTVENILGFIKNKIINTVK